MMSEQNKNIVRRYREIHNTNRLDKLDEIVAVDLISHNMFPGLPAGLAGGKASHQFLNASFPDSKVVTDDLIAEGDKVVERWTNTGSHSGVPFLGTPPSGKKFSVSGISIYRIANGKIVEHWGEFDSAKIAQQLELMPPQM
jgi:steroid delta-isomerase-like uncharacterized protein